MNSAPDNVRQDLARQDPQDPVVERLRQRVLPCLPQAFQTGSLPWVFLLALLIMALMVFFSMVNKDIYGNHIPLIFAAVVGALLVAMSRGLPLSMAVQIAMGVGLLQLGWAAWYSGGIYSPRLSWLLLLPLTPFFFFGPRVGLRLPGRTGSQARGAGADPGQARPVHRQCQPRIAHPHERHPRLQ
jgi:hypothetical protein